MRHILLASALTLLAGCSGGGASRTLVLLHTNDEHSHILGGSPELDDFPTPQSAGTGAIKGGMSRRATIFSAERDRARGLGAAVLTVSAGDNMMGTLAQVAATQASPDFRLMRILGYDITTLGNHEFDFGPAALAQSIQVAVASPEGMVPTVASNIRFSATDPADDSLAALYDSGGADATKPIHKWLVLTASNGLKVGFAGVVGVDAAFKAPTKAPVTFSVAACCGENNAPATLSQIFDDLQPTIDLLRRDQKVDVVVLLSHAGVNEQVPEAGEDYQIAKNVSGIDVIVSGHTHSLFPAKTVTNDRTGKPVLIQQAGAFGQWVGRIQLSVAGDGTIAFDGSQQALLAVDDTTLPGNPTVDAFMAGVVSSMESTKVVTLPGGTQLSFLEYTLTQIDGGNFLAPVKDNASVAGDLYFRKLGTTSFDVPYNALHKESQAQILAADAELWAAEQALGPNTAEVAVYAQGAVRADIKKGKTGAISFADLYSVVPLGGSPGSATRPASPGYPLCRFVVSLAEIKGALDLVAANLAQQSVSNNDYFLVTAGMRFTYDLSRKPFDPSANALDPRNGRVVKIELATSHANGVYEGPYTAIYDATHLTDGAPDPFFGNQNALRLFRVVSNLYVAQLSFIGGVKLKDPTTGKVMASPYESIMLRPGPVPTEIKDWEALAAYVKNQSDGNGGALPARYNPAVSTSARRAICVGGACPQ
jgi:5'-nucleotidase